MDIKQLQYFLKVCDKQSFSAASADLYITQQGLSSAIKKIEDELGISLFVRTPKGIILTEYARLLLPYAEDFCRHYENLLSEIDTIKKNKLGKINLDISLGLMGTYSSFSFETFRKENPNVELHITECTDIVAMSHVLNYDTELAVVSGPVDANLFDSITLKTSGYTLIVETNHPLASNNFITFEKIKNESIISLYEKFNVYHNFVDQCHRHGFEPNIVSTTIELLHLFNLCKLNKGVGISIDFANKYFSFNNIKAIPFAEPNYQWEACIIYKKEHQLSPIAKSIIDYLLSLS